MGEIAKKRDLIGACRDLIPVMDDIELNTLANTLNVIIKHILERGVEIAEE